MDLKLVAKTEAVRKVRESTYSEDLKNAVAEIWQYSQEYGSTHNLETPAFESEVAAAKWLEKAQAYGKTQGVFVHRARGVVPSEPNALVLNAESLADREQRIQERKDKLAARAAEVEAAQVAGVEPPAPRRGRKRKAQQGSQESGE